MGERIEAVGPGAGRRRGDFLGEGVEDHSQADKGLFDLGEEDRPGE